MYAEIGKTNHWKVLFRTAPSHFTTHQNNSEYFIFKSAKVLRPVFILNGTHLSLAKMSPSHFSQAVPSISIYNRLK